MPVRLDPIILSNMQVSSELVNTIRNPSLLLQNASASGGNSVNPEPLLSPTTVMSDDHSKLAPLLPISNRTVKRLRANDSVHYACESRSSSDSYKVKSPTSCWAFCFVNSKLMKCANSIMALVAVCGFRRNLGTGKSLSFVSFSFPMISRRWSKASSALPFRQQITRSSA